MPREREFLGEAMKAADRSAGARGRLSVARWVRTVPSSGLIMGEGVVVFTCNIIECFASAFERLGRGHYRSSTV